MESPDALLPGSPNASRKSAPSSSTTPSNPANCWGALPGPPTVKYIILSELCERFSFYGLRAILVLYMTEKLLYTEDQVSEESCESNEPTCSSNSLPKFPP